MGDNFWTVFWDTGDIVCYLLWKAEGRRECEDDKKRELAISSP